MGRGVRRYHNKRDGNEPDIIDALVKRFGEGNISIIKSDNPDLIVGWDGSTKLFEVKMPGASLIGSENKVKQLRSMIRFQGELWCVDNPEDAIAIMTGELVPPQSVFRTGDAVSLPDGRNTQISNGRWLLHDWWYETLSENILRERGGKVKVMV